MAKLTMRLSSNKLELLKGLFGGGGTGGTDDGFRGEIKGSEDISKDDTEEGRSKEVISRSYAIQHRGARRTWLWDRSREEEESNDEGEVASTSSVGFE
jgi:hypothetical protein